MSSRFCNISGNIFLFTSEADVGLAKIITAYCSSTSVFMTNNTHSGAKIWRHKPIKLNKYEVFLKYGGHGVQLMWYMFIII